MRCLSLFASLLLLGLSSCAADQTTHPPLLDCSNDNCKTSSGAHSVSGSSSNGGASSSGTSGAAGQVTLTGQVVQVDEPNYSVSKGTPASDNYTIVVPGANGTDLSNSNLAPIFSVDGVRSSNAIWVTAKPMVANDFMAGVVALNSITTTNVTVPVVRQSSLEMVGLSNTSPVTLNSLAGQVVMHFVDNTGASVKGIRATFSGAEAVIYDSVGGYTVDNSVGTGTRGLIFLLNVSASKTPLSTTVSLTGTVTAQFSFFVMANAATALEVQVSPN